MDKKNRYCKGYTAWLAHASRPRARTKNVTEGGKGIERRPGASITYSGRPTEDGAYEATRDYTWVHGAQSTSPDFYKQGSSSKPHYTSQLTDTVRIEKPSDLPSNWETSSPDFKKWKKEYNTWYYRNHPEKWNLDKSPMSSTANGYKDKAYKQAAEARSRAQYDRTNYDRRSNAQKMLDRSNADPGQSRPTFSGELFNAKTRLNDLWSVGAGSIVSAGKSVINKAKTNRSSFNDMWSNGASAIASAGKSFLDAWKSGLKR